MALSKGRVLADNAAGAQLPDSAIAAVNTYLRQSNAQKGKIFARGEFTSEIVATARHGIATLLGAQAQAVAFGPNATTLAFHLARLLAGRLQAGAQVIVSAADHESNVAPWMWLRRFGAEVTVISVDDRGDLDETAFCAALEREPALVALPWASNLTGTVYDIARFARLAKDAGALVVVDGVQAAPHLALTIDPAIDAAFFSAYKVFAPHFGFAYLRREFRERFLREDDEFAPGGSLSWTMETGTQCYEAIAGWTGTLRYLLEVGEGNARTAMQKFAAYEARLTAFALENFAARSETVELYGRAPGAARLPVFAFNVRGVDASAVAESFDDAGIEGRIGDYYSPRLLRRLAPGHNAAIRLSFVHYNSMQDVERCFTVLDEIVAKFRARGVAST